MIFVPYKTDAPIRRTPAVNVTLIVANVLLFFVTEAFGRNGGVGDAWGESVKNWGVLDPRNLALYQFFSYQFLHGDIWHLVGNMLFLWVFGNAVNSKMGNAAYLMFYLAAGAFAGVGFAMTSSNPCLGASGAIAGVTTAFLVLYPHSVVSVFFWFFVFSTFHIQALWLIVLKIIVWDNILSPNMFAGEMTTVAYSAHLAGYLFGFSLCLLLLMVKALPRDQYDILALIKRYNQRRQFRTLMADPNARAQATLGRVAQPVSVFSGRPIAVPAADDAVIRLRQEIADALSRGANEEAVEKYEALMMRDSTQILSRKNMLDIAMQMKALEKYPQAVSAYEKFLSAYPSDPEAPHAQMMLGILYTKYLQQHDRAEMLFRECRNQLSDPNLRELTDQWLNSVLAALGKPLLGETGPASGG